MSSDLHDGLLTDSAIIEWIPEGKVKKAEPLRNGNPPGSIRIRLEALKPPSKFLTPSVSLILALPRPLQLGRMLPMISQMGVDQLILTEARKVPKDYFGSHLFRKPELLTELLIEGLCPGDVRSVTRASSHLECWWRCWTCRASFGPWWRPWPSCQASSHEHG